MRKLLNNRLLDLVVVVGENKDANFIVADRINFLLTNNRRSEIGKRKVSLKEWVAPRRKDVSVGDRVYPLFKLMSVNKIKDIHYLNHRGLNENEYAQRSSVKYGESFTLFGARRGDELVDMVSLDNELNDEYKAGLVEYVSGIESFEGSSFWVRKFLQGLKSCLYRQPVNKNMERIGERYLVKKYRHLPDADISDYLLTENDFDNYEHYPNTILADVTTEEQIDVLSKHGAYFVFVGSLGERWGTKNNQECVSGKDIYFDLFVSVESLSELDDELIPVVTEFKKSWEGKQGDMV